MSNLSDFIGGGGVAADYQEFTTSGTWTKPADVNFVYVEILGAGAGGGCRTDTGVCPGGSGGEFVSKILSASDLSASETVIIGAGGLGPPSNGSGANGGSSFFAGFQAFGGKGGVASSGFVVGPLRGGGGIVDASTLSGISPHPVFASYGANGGSIRGNCIYGGGGGGAPFSAPTNEGGISEFAGNGGVGNSSSGVKGGNGVYPAGGGGGSNNGGGGGDGANGRVRVWAW